MVSAEGSLRTEVGKWGWKPRLWEEDGFCDSSDEVPREELATLRLAIARLELASCCPSVPSSCSPNSPAPGVSSQQGEWAQLGGTLACWAAASCALYPEKELMAAQLLRGLRMHWLHLQGPQSRARKRGPGMASSQGQACRKGLS